MEENRSLPEKKVRTLEDDPQYFGGYLNMARLNIYNISNHIAPKFNQAVLREEGDIPDSFLQNNEIKKLNWNHVYSMLVRFMPVVRVFNFEELPKKTREDLSERGRVPNMIKDLEQMSHTLGLLFKEIQAFRNDYTHYYSTETATERKKSVSPEVAEFIKQVFGLAIEYTKARMQDVLNDGDYDLVERKAIVNPDNTITTEGLVFLICLFLEREQAFQFIGKVQGLKGTQYSSFIATREVLMAFCVKLPHDKFVSEDRKHSLTLDMINELNRCPKTLYNVITEEKKSRFRPNLELEKRQRIIDNSLQAGNTADWEEPEYREYVEELIKRVRYEKRFSYFALRYIDEMELFSKLRFHINIGRIELASYTKLLAGEDEPRRVVENVNGFGKLSEYVDEKTVHTWIDPNGATAGFDRFNPHYKTDNNKIGLSRKSKNARLLDRTSGERKIEHRLSQPLPDAFLSLNELPKIILLEYLKKGEAEKIITGFIDLNRDRLLTWEFIEEVKAKLPDTWNMFEKRADSKNGSAYSPGKLEYLKSRKAVLNSVLVEYGLNDKQIPTRILNYWLNIAEVDGNRLFADRVKRMKRDCKERLKTMARHRQDPAVRIPKVGEMASFLAKDIVDMVVSEEKKGKISSFYYDKMQECIAFYADDEKKGLFREIINELGLYEKGGHPFLSRVMEVNHLNTAGFYVAYLQEKADKQIPGRKKGQTEDVSWMATTFYTTGKDKKTGKWRTVIQMPEDPLSEDPLLNDSLFEKSLPNDSLRKAQLSGEPLPKDILPENRLSGETLSEESPEIPYTIRQWAKKKDSDLRQWLENTTKKKRKPVDLPTNLFDDKLRELLGAELTSMDVEYHSAFKCNELFKLWWESRGDTTQEFYRSEREYEVYGEKIQFIPHSEKKFKSYYDRAYRKTATKNKRDSKKQTDAQLKRVFKQAIAGTEREIRVLEEEDRLLLLMVEQMTKGSQGESAERMENVQLSRIDRLLNETVPVKMVLNYDLQGKVVTGKQAPVLTRVIATECKRKNYTELRKYIHDRRLFGLFNYVSMEEVQLEWLKKELAAYNSARQNVFDTVFELEKHIVDHDAEGLKALFIDDEGALKNGNIQHFAYLTWLKNNGMINEEEKLFLENVRNAFSHNQFPKREGVLEEMVWESEAPIAEQITALYTREVGKIIHKITGYID